MIVYPVKERWDAQTCLYMVPRRQDVELKIVFVRNPRRLKIVFPLGGFDNSYVEIRKRLHLRGGEMSCPECGAEVKLILRNPAVTAVAP